MHAHGIQALALGVIVSLASPAQAFWRMPCPATLVQERADPIIEPGEVSAHVHAIMGGDGFGFNMTYDQARASTCSSCPISADMSNYWVPTLYYHAQNGSFLSVKNIGSTVYYEQRPGNATEKLHAFPEGFRMIAGDPFKRNYTGDFAAQAVSYVCLDYSGGAPGQTTGFQQQNCADGLRAQLYFPSCWDGVNLDTPDHKSHMAYPIQIYNGGYCPSTHPVHMISLFYETIWQINDFADGWYDGTTPPFVLSTGDPTGYGYHGDFVNGWDVSVLQNAVDNCNDPNGIMENCEYFTLTTDASANCMIEPSVDEQVFGVLDALPGCNPVQNGPEPATQQTGCGATMTISAPSTNSVDLSSIGWEYVGCATDNVNARTLTGYTSSTDNMTVEGCVEECSAKGYTFAGLEYADQCYCGDSVASADMPVKGVIGNCQMACSGNSAEYCGGGSALSLYQKTGANSTTTAATTTATPSRKRSTHRRRRHANHFLDSSS
ncbi:MAG: hypothetical protein M1819_002612 [Sarea resinae]|nr:MAG: hypothetical protein M1819_002612 [Sarea resinae]